MLTIFVHRNGRTEPATSLDRAWLDPSSNVYVWVDLAEPSIPESLILSDTFAFHPLSVEDAMAEVHFPKIEAYDGYLYAVLHGIRLRGRTGGFTTHDVDFFIGPSYLVTVHDGHSRSVADLREMVIRNPKVMGEGPIALFHRIVDTMVDHYRPEVDQLEDRLDDLETAVFGRSRPELVRQILDEKRQVSALRRIVTPQRDVIARLARREFVDVGTDLSFRFRDIYDSLVRIADDAMICQDRITGILEAHLTNVSNRLNQVMQVLTIVSTIFMPLTLMSGLWGMNIPLPRFPGSDAVQFWWLSGLMAGVVGAMLAMFRVKRWI
jgi:magnesium transporter